MQLDTVTDSDAFAHVIFVSVDTCASARFPADPVSLLRLYGVGAGPIKKSLQLGPMRYGAYWKRWSKQRTWTSKGSITALSLRDQKIFKMNNIGEYEIHEAILELKDTARPDTAI